MQKIYRSKGNIKGLNNPYPFTIIIVGNVSTLFN